MKKKCYVMSDHQEMMKKKFHSDNFQLVELKIRICKEIGKMKKISMQFILRIIAIVVFIGGAFIGYDVGCKMVTINQVVSYQFSFVDALIVWFMSFAIGVLFLAIAKIIDLLEGQ